MATDEAVAKELENFEAETQEITKEIEAYARKLWAPAWNKRREIVKKIPNFWSQALGNTPVFSELSDSDLEALNSLTDFHVEIDEKRPEYRKITAYFSKNDTFKNETLTKEFTVEGDDGSVISKTTVDYYPGKAPNPKKRKAPSEEGDEDDEEFDLSSVSFLEWFSSDEVGIGAFLSDEFFPNVLDYYNGEEDDEDEGEIELGSEEEEDEEEEENARPGKKQKK